MLLINILVNWFLRVFIGKGFCVVYLFNRVIMCLVMCVKVVFISLVLFLK